MKKRRSSPYLVPIILALIVTAALVVGYFTGMSGEPEPPPPQEIPNEYWRCLACVKVPGQNYHQCKTVTGRGNELGARERAKQRACTAAKAPLEECEVIDEIRCTRLEKAQAVGARPRVELVEEPEE
jgi:hypothetical protein